MVELIVVVGTLAIYIGGCSYRIWIGNKPEYWAQVEVHKKPGQRKKSA